MKKIQLKKFLPYLLSIGIMLVISHLYFTPDIFEGKVLFQHDTQQGMAIGHEAQEFAKKTGETTRWTNSLFSGMPTYQISPSYGNNAWIRMVSEALRLWNPTVASLVFIMMLGFFILLMTMGVSWPISLFGAIAYAFSSYFFIIIQAGHIWKFVTLAYIPPTIAGVMLAYRGKFLWGGILTALFGTLQITSNHVQMTYYFLFVIVAIVIASFVSAYKAKQMPRFAKATGVLIVAGILAVGANIPSLYNTYEYTKQTIRGGSELTPEQGQENTPQQGNKKGLDKDYITQWSYGIGETWTLLIPDTKGGATGVLGADKDAMKKVPAQSQEIIAQMNRYWGDQPMTSGPVYVGAFVLMLFLVGCFVVKTPLKWALLSMTLFSILLSWGRNFMPLTDWFIDYFPMYDKFRTVSSILVIAEFCIPLLAVLALQKIVENPRIIIEQKKYFIASYVLTGGIAALFALLPEVFFTFLGQQEIDMMRANPEYGYIFTDLIKVRAAIFAGDAWRSFFIITLGCGVLFLYGKSKINKTVFLVFVIALTLFDMYTVNKRYLNSKDFVPARTLTNPFPMSEADKQILQDTDPNYRVLNLTTSTFNDAATSYHHKSIGGYHAAKLQRYQDLIERQIAKNNRAVINMLNAKYFIIADEQGNPQAMRNPEALGNAWFADEIKWVDNADAEMAALTGFDPRKTAVIDKRFETALKGANPQASQLGDTIYLTSYKPNELTYKSKTKQEAFAVFSEVYYPHGWKVTIDGKPAEPVRVDYVLRGLVIPAGDHEINFTFDPEQVKITEAIAYACLIIIMLLIIWAVYKKIKCKS